MVGEGSAHGCLGSIGRHIKQPARGNPNAYAYGNDRDLDAVAADIVARRLSLHELSMTTGTAL